MAYPLPLQAARVIANNDHPYLNALLWSLQPVECPGLGTLAVDQYLRLYYDPVVATKWSPQELANVLYHETWHVINNHAARAEALGIASHGRYTDLALAEIWRIAVEPPANEPLRQENLMLPGRPIFWQDIKGQPNWTVEENYRHLLKNAKKIQVAVGTSPGQGNCGSCADGVTRDYEEGAPTTNNASGTSSQMQNVLMRKVAHDIAEYASKKAGSMPADMLRWATERLNPQVPWQTELAAEARRGIAETMGTTDYSYSRPSRRQHSFPFLLPCLRGRTPRVAVIADTSGSMSPTDLAAVLAETEGILSACTGDVFFLPTDAAVHGVHRIRSVSQAELRGGGGTDMGQGLTRAEDLFPPPDLVVVLTDGETPWPPVAPPFKTIVVIINKEQMPTPEWAKTLYVTPEKKAI